ncbi:hypothetical protein CNR22_16805 [Sphingobacteriaceae bacterium]|nr:hypothetical protein CNR22_16805 [Sphingobacteriaceae bacterium]
MQKKISLVILAILTLCFTECKKGEDDPVISLRTRKARAAGEWRLVSGNASYTAKGYNEDYAFDGTNVTANYTSVTPIIYTGRYILNLTISKDGKFTFKEVVAGLSLEAGGDWTFNKGGGEDKKKEDFIFTITSVSKGSTNELHFFNRLNTNFTYQIKELRNKRLVIHSAGTFYTDSKGNYSTLSTDYVFQQ